MVSSRTRERFGEIALVLSTSVFWKETSLTLVNTQLQFPAESFHEEKEVSPCRWVRTNTSVSSSPFLSQWLFENFTALKPLPLLTPGIRVNFVHELSPSVIVPWNEPYHSTWMCISHCLLLTQENPIFPFARQLSLMWNQSSLVLVSAPVAISGHVSSPSRWELLRPSLTPALQLSLLSGRP